MIIQEGYAILPPYAKAIWLLKMIQNPLKGLFPQSSPFSGLPKSVSRCALAIGDKDTQAIGKTYSASTRYYAVISHKHPLYI